MSTHVSKGQLLNSSKDQSSENNTQNLISKSSASDQKQNSLVFNDIISSLMVQNGNSGDSGNQLIDSQQQDQSSSSSQISSSNNAILSQVNLNLLNNSNNIFGDQNSGINRTDLLLQESKNREDFNEFDLVNELGLHMNGLEQFKDVLFNDVGSRNLENLDNVGSYFNPWNSEGGIEDNTSSILANLKRPIAGGHLSNSNRSNGWTSSNGQPKSISPTSNANNATNGWAQPIMQSKFDRNPLNSSQGNIRPNNNNNNTQNGSKNGNQSPNMYNLFPKRPHNRLMSYWKQQQQIQQGSNGPKSKANDPDAHQINESLLNNGANISDIIKSLDNVSLNSFYSSAPSSAINTLSTNQSNTQITNGPQNSAGKNSNESSSLGGIEESCLFDNRNVASQNYVNNSQTSNGTIQNREEGFSRKVFVGGLPPDIDEEEITTAFRRFGELLVDWPHKSESKAYFPPKGYCFLLFVEESSVQTLINACILDEGKYYWCVSSPTMKDKPVQIRPWNLADSDYVMDAFQPLDPRKTIFVGGVPRPLKAVELALIMDRLYGGVCYAGIDTDPDLKYPKGAGRVAFSNQQSYIAAISARFVQLQHNDIDKRVEVKPYVLDNQMCDECQGARCGGKFAPFFCANVTCLQYYCEQCWVHIHSRQGREFHKPLVKEGADRPRPTVYRW